jgi:hypothetical protein
VITVHTNPSEGKDGEIQLAKLAEECGIWFDPDMLTSVVLLSAHLGDINEYPVTPIPNFEHLGSIKSEFFNTESLRFEPMRSGINLDGLLVKYELRRFEQRCVLWKRGIAYGDSSPNKGIDKSWGRMIALRDAKMNIMVYDRGNALLGVPSTVPLPKLVSKGVHLMSGKVPRQKLLPWGNTTRLFSVFSDVPFSLASNALAKIGQRLQEVRIS